jgi:hypothetical protein
MSTTTQTPIPAPIRPPNPILSWLNTNKVLIFGLISGAIMAIQQFASIYPNDYGVLALAAAIAIISYLAKDLRGQWPTILGSTLPSLGVVLTTAESHKPIEVWQLIGSLAIAIGGAVAPPAKSLSYEKSATILAAKSQAAQSDATTAKSPPVAKVIAFIAALMLISSMINAQSPFKAEPKLSYPQTPDKFNRTAVNPLTDSIVNAFRFAVAVSPAGFTFNGTYQAAAGLEAGFSHQDYNYKTQLYTVLYSVNAVWIPINTSVPITSLKQISSFGALVGIKNNLIQLGPFCNPFAVNPKDRFGIWAVLGINFNNL